MEKYHLGMVPGPTMVPEEVLKAGMKDYGAAYVEKEYLQLYKSTQKQLQKILKTKNDIVIQTGEGMLALWSAMKSSLLPGDRVLVLASGIFGYGMADMAESLGCEVKIVGFAMDESISDFDLIEKAIVEFKPKMITVVQNETPSGTMNPIAEIGELKYRYNVPLLYVDVVSGFGGSVVETDLWHVDFALGASQKCLSAPASLSFLSVSDAAWKIIEDVAYVGYDALLPFKNAVADFNFPYTPYWHGLAQLHTACDLLLKEGLAKVIKRHYVVAEYCRKRAVELGLELYPREGAIYSPTVTAIYVPNKMISWKKFDKELRARGLAVGGNIGCLDGKVFRIGHMGSQANLEMLKESMDIIEEVIKKYCKFGE